MEIKIKEEFKVPELLSKGIFGEGRRDHH